MKNKSLVVPGLILLFGLFAVGNWTSIKWVVLTLGLYAMPLLALLTSNVNVRAYASWLGVFLILQTLATPLVIDRNYKTLPPNMQQRIDVIGDAMPGVNGIQQITTDQRGFRVSQPINYDTRDDDTYRIFAIGGSTTEQIVLDDKHTWTHLLEAQLSAGHPTKHFEVINTGISGARAEQHLATLKKIVPWHPDMALFLVGINDWNRHVWNELGRPDRKNPGVPSSPVQFSESLLGLILKNLLTARESDTGDAVTPEYGEYYSQQNDSLNRAIVKSFSPSSVDPEYERVLFEIRDVCAANEILCVFVTQPSGYGPGSDEQLRRYFWMTPPNTDYTLDFASLGRLSGLYNDFLLDFSATNDLASCDLAGQFPGTIENLYDDCHFNRAGARHAASLLTECLNKYVAP